MEGWGWDQTSVLERHTVPVVVGLLRYTSMAGLHPVVGWTCANWCRMTPGGLQRMDAAWHIIDAVRGKLCRENPSWPIPS